MLFGSQTNFAIECEIDAKSSEKKATWIFGRMRLWLAGTHIGDYTQMVVMSLPADGLAELLERRGALAAPELCGMGAREVVHFLQMALYDGDHDLKESVRLEREYRKFVLCPGLSEAFDGTTVVVMECADRVRVVGQGFESPTPQQALLPAADFYETVASFGHWFVSVKSQFSPPG